MVTLPQARVWGGRRRGKEEEMVGRDDDDVVSSTHIDICSAGFFRNLRVEVVEPCGLDADIWTPMHE